MVCEKKVLLAPAKSAYGLTVFLLVLFFLFFLVSGCRDGQKPILSGSNQKIIPMVSAKNIEVIFSDSGKIQARLNSVLLNRFGGKDPCMEFPKGFKILMFDSGPRVETSITGDYGKRRENFHIMEAKGNVVVRNEIKKQQLNTEHLIWDENKRKIYSDVKVKITTPDKVLYGNGLESDESFSWYRFTNVTGEMTVKKDSI